MMCIDKTIGDSVSGNIYIESFKNFGAEIITIFDMKAIDKKSCNHMNGSIWHPSCIRSILWTTTLLPIGCPISNILWWYRIPIRISWGGKLFPTNFSRLTATNSYQKTVWYKWYPWRYSLTI